MVKRFLALFAGASMSLSLASAQDSKPAPKDDAKPAPKVEAKPAPKEEAKAAPKIDAVALARLVAQLGSDRYDDRETACKELDALGAAALEPLRTALGSKDEETRRRAIHVFERIQLRVETARLTKAKMVRLVYTDMTVAQAVQDMARKTGFQIQIEGDQTKLAARKITIDTGEVPFWQAVDLFCLKAGLVERGSAAIPENNPEMDQMRMERMRMRMWMIQSQEYGGVKPELPVVFLDGKPQLMPTYYAGSLRMRVLPKAAGNAPGATTGVPVNRPEGESSLTVEVTPEPKMGWQNVLSLRVEKMIDDKGNELKLPLPYLRDPNDFDDDEMMGMGGALEQLSGGPTTAKQLGQTAPAPVAKREGCQEAQGDTRFRGGRDPDPDAAVDDDGRHSQRRGQNGGGRERGLDESDGCQA